MVDVSDKTSIIRTFPLINLLRFLVSNFWYPLLVTSAIRIFQSPAIYVVFFIINKLTETSHLSPQNRPLKLIKWNLQKVHFNCCNIWPTRTKFHQRQPSTVQYPPTSRKYTLSSTNGIVERILIAKEAFLLWNESKHSAHEGRGDRTPAIRAWKRVQHETEGKHSRWTLVVGQGFRLVERGARKRTWHGPRCIDHRSAIPLIKLMVYRL